MAKPKSKEKKSELKTARKGKVGYLSIVGVIGWDWFGVSYQGFKQQLADLKGINTLEVDITSPGGVVTDGIAIANALIEHDATVHVYVNSQAASIASVITMAADRIFIPANSNVMVHKPLVDRGGNADDMRKNAEILDTLETGMIATYMRHFKGSEEELRALLTNATWMGAEEFADKFNNVTVMKQELEAVALVTVEDELGDLSQFTATEDPTESDLSEEQTSILNRFVAFLKKPKEPNNQQEADMPLTKEEITEIAKVVTASVVAATKPVAEAPAPAPVVAAVPATPVVTKPEALAFEGDPSSKEDVAAHLAKLKQMQIEASVDWNDTKSVVAYQKAVFGAVETPASNTDAPTGVRGGAGTDAQALEGARSMVKDIRGVK